MKSNRRFVIATFKVAVDASHVKEALAEIEKVEHVIIMTKSVDKTADDSFVSVLKEINL